MVHSYNTLLAEGSISISNRPQSAAHSRSRIDTAGRSPDVKVFANSLYDAGDILAGQQDYPPAPPPQQATPSAAQLQPLMSPMSAAGGSQKLQQQRALAAQKRLERLQIGGLAQSHDSIALVSVNSNSSRPGTPQSAKPSDNVSSAVSATLPAAVPAPPAAAALGPTSRSYRMRSGNSSNSNSTAGAMGKGDQGTAGPWEGSGSVSAAGPSVQPPSNNRSTFEEEDLEVETLDEPVVRPGTASAAPQVGGQHSSVPVLKQPKAAAVDLSNMDLFLRRPAPHASSGAVLCCIERTKPGLGKPAIYRFHLELPNGGYQFLLSARKRVKSATSSYVISTSQDDLGRHSSSRMAKLRSNFVGTGFSIFLTAAGSSSRPDSAPVSSRQGVLGQQQQQQRQLVTSSSAGMGPLQAAHSSLQQQQQQQQHQRQRSRGSSSSSGGGSSSSGRPTSDNVGSAWQAAGQSAGKQEVGAVLYEYNVLGTRGPRKLSAIVPHVDEGGNVLWAPSGPQDSMVERLRAGGSATNHLVVLKNKDPKWNDTLNAYCLNFNGRVTEASVKNFQLVAASDPDTVVLQFGKVSDSCFTCDFSWPVSPMQAFSICLSSFDNKLACE